MHRRGLALRSRRFEGMVPAPDCDDCRWMHGVGIDLFPLDGGPGPGSLPGCCKEVPALEFFGWICRGVGYSQGVAGHALKEAMRSDLLYQA